LGEGDVVVVVGEGPGFGVVDVLVEGWVWEGWVVCWRGVVWCLVGIVGVGVGFWLSALGLFFSWFLLLFLVVVLVVVLSCAVEIYELRSEV
jgi:hypothetical protein